MVYTKELSFVSPAALVRLLLELLLRAPTLVALVCGGRDFLFVWEIISCIPRLLSKSRTLGWRLECDRLDLCEFVDSIFEFFRLLF